jgi:hypothetical protein
MRDGHTNLRRGRVPSQNRITLHEDTRYPKAVTDTQIPGDVLPAPEITARSADLNARERPNYNRRPGSLDGNPAQRRTPSRKTPERHDYSEGLGFTAASNGGSLNRPRNVGISQIWYAGLTCESTCNMVS